MTNSQKTTTTRSSRTALQQKRRKGDTRFFARTVRTQAGTSPDDRITSPAQPRHHGTRGRS